MPIFEFQCAECSSTFEELLRSASSTSDVKCPTCGSNEVRRKVSTFASKGNGGSSSFSAASCAPGGGT